MPGDVKILPYDAGGAGPVVGIKPYDPRAVDVAREVGALIRGAFPACSVEHVGSTAVPGCDGKGIVDLLVLCSTADVPRAKDVLAELGFQPQSGGVQHGDERPMREGSVLHDGTFFRLHVHILPRDSEAVATFRHFRDALLADPELVKTYVAQKRAAVEGGVSTREAYTRSKAPFIQGVLSGGGPHRG